MSKPWNRQPGETAKAYKAFCAYRDMLTDDRSLENVSKLLGKSATLLARWSSANNWVERAAEYDNYLREKDRIEFEKRRKEAKKERLQIIRGAKAKLVEALKNLDVKSAKVAEVVGLLKQVLEQERIEFNDLPDQKNINLDIDMSTLTKEQLERIANGEDVRNIISTTGSGGA